MRTSSIQRSVISFLLAAGVFIGCTFTSTLPKDPVFKEGSAVVRANIDSIILCNSINIYGQEVSTNGKKSSDLEISIINGDNVPANEKEMISLAKKIAISVRGLLVDPNEYTTYSVLFVTEEKNSTGTDRKWIGKTFKREEL